MTRLYRVVLALLCLGAPACLGTVPPPAAPPPRTAPAPTPFTDPAGLFTVLAPGPGRPRVAQEITHVGTVNFTLHAFDQELYAFRAYAFEYPWCGSPDPRGCGPVFKFDAPGDLWHSSGKAIARMGGRPEQVRPVSVDGIGGRETLFSLPRIGGRGVMVTLISAPPRPRRHVAFCLAPVAQDFAPCLAFVRSLRPR